MVIDQAIALRIIYLLTKPFDKWPAFKEGIIDADGNIIHKGANSTNWTMLHRLVMRIKKLLAMVPGGSTKIGTMLAAYALVKEGVDENTTDEQILEKLQAIRPKYSTLVEYSQAIIHEEDAPANNTMSTGVKDTSDAAPAKPKGKKNVTNPIKRQY